MYPHRSSSAYAVRTEFSYENFDSVNVSENIFHLPQIVRLIMLYIYERAQNLFEDKVKNYYFIYFILFIIILLFGNN